MKPAPLSRAAIDAQIAEFIKTKGITKCPDSVPHYLAADDAGWRRVYESATIERYGISFTLDNPVEHVPPEPDERIEVEPPAVIPKPDPSQRYPYTIACRFFDKLCVVKKAKTEVKAEADVEELTAKYGRVGARFYVVCGSLKTFVTWEKTVKPLLLRQLRRQRQPITEANVERL
jgi:hypothetical protein